MRALVVIEADSFGAFDKALNAARNSSDEHVVITVLDENWDFPIEAPTS